MIFKIITLDVRERSYNIEYNFSENTQGGQLGFGNIYYDAGKTLEFTFSALDHEIFAYTPTRLEKNFISDIYHAILKDR